MRRQRCLPLLLQLRLRRYAGLQSAPRPLLRSYASQPFACRFGAPVQAIAARKEREAAVAKAQMDAALSGGASWGMAEDAFDPDAGGLRSAEGSVKPSLKGIKCRG